MQASNDRHGAAQRLRNLSPARSRVSSLFAKQETQYFVIHSLAVEHRYRYRRDAVLTGHKPVPGARVEIRQTSAKGRYHHERDDSAAPWDPGFQGWGETQTGAEGGYRFRTIKPVAYSGRAPHIHFAVTAPGKRAFYTQFYLADAPENARDFLIRELSEAERARLMVALEPRSGSAGEPSFDIVLP